MEGEGRHRNSSWRRVAAAGTCLVVLALCVASQAGQSQGWVGLEDVEAKAAAKLEADGKVVQTANAASVGAQEPGSGDTTANTASLVLKQQVGASCAGFG